MSVLSFRRKPYLLLATGLVTVQAANAEYQPIISIACPDGTLLIDARPYRAKGAGYSSPIVRYRYRGIELKALHPASYGYPENIAAYLESASVHAYDTGLSEDGRGHWQALHYPKQGETLFLPPAQFTDKEVSRLAACIHNKQQELASALATVKISARVSAITGLEAGIALDGIAFLIHAEFPLADIYSDDWQVIFIERSGRVILYRHYSGTKASPEVIIMGQVLQGKKIHRKPKLLLRPSSAESISVKINKTEWMQKLGALVNRHGERFLDNYNLIYK